MVDMPQRRTTVSARVDLHTYVVTFDPGDAMTGVRLLCSVAAKSGIPWIAVALLKARMLNIENEVLEPKASGNQSRLKK